MKAMAGILPATLVGCVAPPKHTIHFASDPAGASVYWGAGANEDFGQPKSFLGEIPFDWEVDLNGDGSFKAPKAVAYSVFIPPAIVFEARSPTAATNRLVQRLVFHGASIAHGPDKAPEKICFDLYQAK
jgi:hypothetical protein